MKAVNSLLVIAILLFATVITWTYFAVRSTDQNVPQAGIGGGPGETDQTDYRAQFQTLISEHGNLAVAHLSDIYDGQDSSDTAAKLEDNTQKLGDVIKQLGTATDKEIFMQTFRGHNRDYEDYTRARKANNQLAMNEAKENLRMHAIAFGDLIHKLMPSISKESATQLMSDHMTITLAIVDAHANGDTAKELNEINHAKIQGIQMANALADGANEVIR